ncbi:MAG TPA: superoxide dismutase [Candidatus Merdenecus merdavium]|nr:superoxide dismutase [Candidatus Merdenecus merdavium]
MAVNLLPLPYPYDALEPEIETRIMYLHHNEHLAAYVNNVNRLLEPYPEFKDYTAEELILYINSLPAEIQTGIWNNAGGVYNHNLYFRIMCKGQKKEPTGGLAQGIIRDFGSLEGFKKAFKAKALELFGSGYTWLVAEQTGGLSLINTPNQDTVLFYPVKPIILIDLWEHAYYLQYENRKGDYIDAWMNIICWDYADMAYDNL